MYNFISPLLTDYKMRNRLLCRCEPLWDRCREWHTKFVRCSYMYWKGVVSTSEGVIDLCSVVQCICKCSFIHALRCWCCLKINKYPLKCRACIMFRYWKVFGVLWKIMLIFLVINKRFYTYMYIFYLLIAIRC